MNRNRVNLCDAGDVVDSEGMKHVKGFFVDFDVVGVDGGDVGDEVHAALALLLLELEGDAAHRALLDALHQVRREPRDLVP